MTGRALFACLTISMLTAVPVQADIPVSLRGSVEAMIRQHGVAREAGYAFVRTPAEMAALEANGSLVRLQGNEDYGLREGVRSMVARPEMKVFVERLARDYRAACGEKLIITSLTRPVNRQPRNAHRLSVHPAGIAVDLRISSSVECRDWLESTLLDMEEQGLLDGIRERSPPHYHVALFPDAYLNHIGPVIAAERSAERAQVIAARIRLLEAGGFTGVAGRRSESDLRSLWGILAGLPAALFAAFLMGRGSRKSIRG